MLRKLIAETTNPYGQNPIVVQLENLSKETRRVSNEMASVANDQMLEEFVGRRVRMRRGYTSRNTRQEATIQDIGIYLYEGDGSSDASYYARVKLKADDGTTWTSHESAFDLL
jgi:hypothetical protein